MTTNDIEKVEIIPLYEIIKNQQAKQYEYVDLGLPSGLKWAKCNVGAEKETVTTVSLCVEFFKKIYDYNEYRDMIKKGLHI